MARRFAQLPGYDVMHRLGKGAGAIIYSGVDRASRQRVAIKHVTRRGPEDDKYLVQAEREYEVGRRVNHPSLRRCFEMVRIRRWLKTSELFLVMEMLEGELLEDRFADRRPANFDQITEIFARIAEGLHALHALGIAHADMKPNNVILTPDGVKIFDYGQSCELGYTKERVQGTADYIAPEQVLRKPLDQRTDVYNLGATMYRVVTGLAFETIFPGGPVGSKKVELNFRRGNAPPHELNPACPLPLSRLILDCCEHDKDDRPRDMTVILSRLETVRHWLRRKAASSDSAAVPKVGPGPV